MTRLLSYSEAIREAQAQLLEVNDSVCVLGLGVPGPTGVFGTTLGLQNQFGSARVFDIPAAETGVTGVALGMAISGMRPILVHQRVDFAVLSMEPIVNQAAKWHYMYGGQGTAPLTIRMVIGRGWGQGPQHSQSLQAWFAHVPGLQVLMPTTPSDAKGMLIAAVLGDRPTIILEHRWLFDVVGDVPSDLYQTELGRAFVRREGTDVTLIGTSYMTLECLSAAEQLNAVGISAEVVDLATISPLDVDTCLASVKQTGRLVIADTGHEEFGVAAEVIASVCTRMGTSLKGNPVRVGLPKAPTPTTPALSDHYYPRASTIVKHVAAMFGVEVPAASESASAWKLDVPNAQFKGPY